MKQIKTLLKKELQTHWTTLLIPSWFTAGVLLVSLAGMIYALIQGMDMQFFVH